MTALPHDTSTTKLLGGGAEKPVSCRIGGGAEQPVFTPDTAAKFAGRSQRGE